MKYEFLEPICMYINKISIVKPITRLIVLKYMFKSINNFTTLSPSPQEIKNKLLLYSKRRF